MKCSKCSSSKVLVEALGGDRSRVVCQECRHVEVVNATGQRLLTDDRSSHHGAARPLTEG